MSPIALETPQVGNKFSETSVKSTTEAIAAESPVPSYRCSSTRETSIYRYGQPSSDVAIVGIGCRLPGAATNPQAFWDMLMRKESAHSPIPKTRFDVDKFIHPDRNRPASMTTSGGYFLRDDPTEFEPQLFNMNPAEAASLDPALKKLLEVAFETIESAGIPLENLAGSNTGCYVGSFNHDELFSKTRDPQFADAYTGTSAIAPFLANRISYIFDLHGPSMTVDTACSASLYALHLACQAIRCGEIDSAIVASSNLIWSPDMQMFLGKLGALSPTSQCHVFGADADGYGRADGFVGFFLKDLQTAVRDGDAIHAVIRGTAVNSNGRTGGITHPNPKSQQAAMSQAYRSAGNLDPLETAYYECHGTGTAVGDPLEIKGIQQFFSSRTRDNPLLLGSVKTNIGHGEPVSGLSGLLKAVLAIKNGIIPPMITPKVINPNLNLDHTRFKLLAQPHEWPEHLPRRASVASSGFGGANAHAIVEEYMPACEGLSPFRDDLKDNASQDDYQQKYLLPFSAHKMDSLIETAAAITKASGRYRPIDLAYTLGVRRSRMLHRGFRIISENLSDSTDESFRIAKRIRTTAPRIGFVFTGQGAQWPQMGKELFGRFPVFRESISRMSSALHDLTDGPQWNLTDILLAPKSTSLVYSAEISQPACTALQIAIVAVLKSWGIGPTACVGHSSGEMAAAYAAGLITEGEAIIAAHYRGKSVARLSREGAMIAIGMGDEAAQKYLAPLKPGIKVAAVNSPESITVSGDVDAIKELSVILTKDGIFNRILATGGKAYHSDHMVEVGEIFESSMRQAFCSSLTPSGGETATSFFSSVLGDCLPRDLCITPSYWRQNLENPVLFSPALSRMVESGVDHLIEIGPHSALAGPIRQLEQQFRNSSQQFPLYSPSLVRGKDGEDCMLELAGSLFNDRANVDVEEVNKFAGLRTKSRAEPIVLTDLPTYRYAYGPSGQRTNRLDQEFRYPQHPYDDLLGSRVLGSSPSAPVWRNVLTEKGLPMLNGTKYLGRPQMPVSCLLTMALRAAKQIDISRRDQFPVAQTLVLKDIRFAQTLILDEPKDVVTSLQEDGENAASFHFQISSMNGKHAIVHCSGRMAFEGRTTSEREDSIITSSNHIHAPIDTTSTKFYKTLENVGLCYDASWQTLRRISSNPLEGFVRCGEIIPVEGLPEQVGLIEASLQLAALSATPSVQARNLRASRPVKIKNVVFHGFAKTLASCIATAQGQSTQSVHTKVASVKVSSRDDEPVLFLENVSMEEIPEARRPVHDPDQALKLVKKLDFETIQQHQTETLFPAPPFPGVEIFSKVHKLASAMVLCFMACGEARPKTFCEAGKSLMEWLESASLWANDNQILHAADLIHMPPDKLSDLIESLYKEVAEDSVEAQLMMRMYRSLSGVLEGTVSAHDLLMSDGLLGKLYTSTLTASGSMIQLRRLIDLVGHKNPSAKYLEIGGGTRGATREVLDVLGARSGPRRYSSYCFTDVSSYFLSGARDEFRECDDISYATLNIEVSPLEQGFEGEAYDVVVAANVLHATSSVQRTLKHARSLLKPGGKLILVETTIETVWLTIVLGGFADYWKGRRDGRPTSPFIPVTEWSRILEKSGFTAPQIDLPDYEPAFRTMNVLVATAVDENEIASTETRGLTEIERFYPLQLSGDAKDPEKSSDAVISLHQHTKAFVLVDTTGDGLFTDLTLWLVEHGIRHLILARSYAYKADDGDSVASVHIKKLRSLGIQIATIPEPLTAIDERRLLNELRVTVSAVGGVIFGRPPKDEFHSWNSTNIADLHRRARKIFTAGLKPEKILMLADSNNLLPSASPHDAALALAIRSQADAWTHADSPSFVLNMGQEEKSIELSKIDTTGFDQVVPQIRALLDPALSAQTYGQCFVYGLSPAHLVKSFASPELVVSLKHDERWSILLGATEHMAAARNNEAASQIITPKAAALARFSSTATAGDKAHSDAAIDAVAEILAEILFLPREQIDVAQRLTNSGIDSLVASELKSQLKQSFGKDIQTGWLLSGEVTLMDVANNIIGV